MAEHDGSAALAALADDYWRWTCREFPLTAFMAGAANDDPVMFREAPADFARRASEAEAMQARLDRIALASLPIADQATHRLLRRELDDLRAVHALGAHRRPWLLPVGPEFNTIFFANMSSVADARSATRYVDRLATLPAFLGDVGANLREGVEAGYRYPAVVVARAEANLRAVAAGPLDALPWAQPFKRSPAAASPPVQAEAARAGAVIADGIVPALVALADQLRDEVALRARDTIACTDDIDGRAYYAHWVRHFTTTDLDPDAIHALGLAEAERIEAEIAATAAEAGFAGDVAAYRRFLTTDPQFVAPTAEALRERVESLAKRIDGKLPAFFGRVPRSVYGIESIPAASAANLPPAYAQPAPGDGSAPGIVWVSGIPSMCPLWLAPSLALHEGWPGHLMHLALMQEAALPQFRRHNAVKYTACLEGWAMYCEDLGEEMQMYRSPHERFGRLDMELWRALRMVVDTGIHWKGWSRDRAIAEMTSRLSLSRATIEGEVDRYIALPAQALGYKTGHLAFRALRAKAERALGADFDVRRFHDRLLAAGPVTLPVLEDEIGAWLEEQVAAH